VDERLQGPPARSSSSKGAFGPYTRHHVGPERVLDPRGGGLGGGRASPATAPGRARAHRVGTAGTRREAGTALRLPRPRRRAWPERSRPHLYRRHGRALHRALRPVLLGARTRGRNGSRRLGSLTRAPEDVGGWLRPKTTSLLRNWPRVRPSSLRRASTASRRPRKRSRPFFTLVEPNRFSDIRVADPAAECAKLDDAFMLLSSRAVPLDQFYLPTHYPNTLPGGIPADAFAGSDADRAGSAAALWRPAAATGCWPASARDGYNTSNDPRTGHRHRETHDAACRRAGPNRPVAARGISGRRALGTPVCSFTERAEQARGRGPSRARSRQSDGTRPRQTVRSRATPRFWAAYRDLPPEIRNLAQKAYRLFRENPGHPSPTSRRFTIATPSTPPA